MSLEVFSSLSSELTKSESKDSIKSQKSNFEKPTKSMGKIKIRRLASQESGKVPPKLQNSSYFWQFLVILLSIILAGIFMFPELRIVQQVQDSINLWHDSYEQQYNSIVQGNPEFCHQSLNVEKIFSEIGREVLNQEKALGEIQQLFLNDTKFRGILLAGTPGVGKTLFGFQLMKNFYWQNNIQKHIFNKDVESYSDLNEMLNKLSVCGENLIIVDNLEPKDIEQIEGFRTKAVDKVKQFENEKRSVKLTVIFLVTIPNYNDVQKTDIKLNLETVTKIKDLNTVIFQCFGKTEILSCIKQIMTKESLNINDEGIQNILNSIDLESGCKKVGVKTDVYKIF
ncbi:hypothetical protein ACFFRR_002567 [Megaselia abdita]